MPSKIISTLADLLAHLRAFNRAMYKANKSAQAYAGLADFVRSVRIHVTDLLPMKGGPARICLSRQWQEPRHGGTPWVERCYRKRVQKKWDRRFGMKPDTHATVWNGVLCVSVSLWQEIARETMRESGANAAVLGKRGDVFAVDDAGGATLIGTGATMVISDNTGTGG
jgi:hypothetical protein